MQAFRFFHLIERNSQTRESECGQRNYRPVDAHLSRSSGWSTRWAWCAEPMSSDVLRESWANVSATLSPEFSSAIAGLVVSNLDGLKDFICFLTSRKDASSTRVLAAMQGNADALDNTSFQSYSLAFHQAANQWITNGLQATPTQAASTRRSRVAIGCTALRRLSQSGVSCIPYIADGQLRVPVHRQGEDEGHRPLGEAEWCELKDIPADGRNKIALDLLRAEYVRGCVRTLT